jgi:hypothetical protein
MHVAGGSQVGVNPRVFLAERTDTQHRDVDGRNHALVIRARSDGSKRKVKSLAVLDCF